MRATIGCLMILLLAVSASAQFSLTASVDRSTVKPGESVSLTVTFEGAANGVPNPQMPALTNLKLSAGPFTSTNMSIVNGKVSATASFTYRLKAGQTGRAEIGAARLVYQGKEYASAPISITVTQATPSTAQGTVDQKSAGEDVFLRAFADKSEVYQGEQVIVTYKIYFAVQMTNPEITQLPRAPGFWIEELAMPAQLQLSDEVVNGRAYKTAVIRKLALFPTSTGLLELEPMQVNTRVERNQRRRSNDPFDVFNDPFFRLGRSMEPVEVESPRVKIRSLPLPLEGQPADFNGAVGNFKIQANIDRTAANTNDAVTLTVRIEGTGNIKTLAEPSIVFPTDFDHYDPKIGENVRKEGNRVSGSKNFEYVIIPRAPGDQIVPPISLSFFDPSTNKYASISTQEIRLKVAKGDGIRSSEPTAGSGQKREVTSTGTDIAFAKTRPGKFYAIGSFPHRELVFWAFTTGPWAVLAAVWVAVRCRNAAESSRPLGSRLARSCEKLMAESRKRLAKGNSAEACREVSEMCGLMLSAGGSLVADDMTQSERWSSLGWDDSLLQRVRQLQRDCDRVLFGAGSANLEDAKAFVNTAHTLLREFGDMTNRRTA